jgi:hypothetical protein
MGMAPRHLVLEDHLAGRCRYFVDGILKSGRDGLACSRVGDKSRTIQSSLSGHYQPRVYQGSTRIQRGCGIGTLQRFWEEIAEKILGGFQDKSPACQETPGVLRQDRTEIRSAARRQTCGRMERQGEAREPTPDPSWISRPAGIGNQYSAERISGMRDSPDHSAGGPWCRPDRTSAVGAGCPPRWTSRTTAWNMPTAEADQKEVPNGSKPRFGLVNDANRHSAPKYRFDMAKQ